MYVSRRGARIAAGASALTLVAAVCFVVYTHFAALQVAALAKAHDLVQSSLQESLGRKVTVGSITAAGLDSIVVSDVIVPAMPGEGTGAPVLEVDEVAVDYSLLDVIFRRKPLVQTITSVTLVKPVARVGRAPDGGIWPRDLFVSQIVSPDGVEALSGSIIVRDGRVEVTGVPGLRETVALEGIQATVSSVGAGLVWRMSGRTGPKAELRLAAAGTLDMTQKAFACDATVSGAMPAGVLEDLRRALRERPDILAWTGAGLGPELLAYLDAEGKVELSGGKLRVDAHIRPGQDGGRLVRGEVSIAQAGVVARDPAPWLRSLRGVINLASEFQADPAGFSCQGKVSLSTAHAELDGGAAGLGTIEALTQAEVDFWQKPGEALSFEGCADLDIPDVSMGDVVRRTLAGAFYGSANAGIGDGVGTLEVDGPVDASIAFAGQSGKGVEVRGKVTMAAGRMLVDDLVPEVPRVSGDVAWELEFTRDAMGALTCTGRARTERASVTTGRIAGVGDFEGDVRANMAFSAAWGETTSTGESGSPARLAATMAPTYEGEISILSGTVRLSYPALGLTSAKGSVTGQVRLRGEHGGATEYSGRLSVADATVAMTRPREGVKSLESGASGTIEFEGAYPGRARFEGSVDLREGGVTAEFSGPGAGSVSGEARTRGTVRFSGEYPGRIEYRGTMDASRGRLAVRDVPGGLTRWESAAEAHVDFGGAHPGRADFSASCSFPRGEMEISNGPAGIARVSGRTYGRASVTGSLPGDLEYDGRIALEDAAFQLADAPGGIESLSGTADVIVDLAGSSKGGLRYSGVAELVSGQVAATNLPGGVRSLRGPARGDMRFAGTYPGTQEFEGNVSVNGADLVVGEIPGIARSLSGQVAGAMSFRAEGGKVEAFSGKAVVAPATFVSDGVHPGVTVARGPLKMDVEFSSARDGHLDIKGTGAISGAHLRGGRLFPGLANVEGEVDASFDFESTPEGVRYEGTAKIVSGKAALGSDVVPGVERVDGNVVATLDFRGVGGKAGTYSGRARLLGGTIKAGEVTKGIELIEGPVDLDVAFSGGVGTSASYVGQVSIRDASFRASEIVPGMKSVTGKMSGEISFASKPDGSVSYDGSADLTHASFAAGAVYPGITELGGNGKAHFTFSHTGGSGLKGTAEITVTGGILAHNAVGSRVEDIAAQITMSADLIEIKGMTGRLGSSRIEASGWLRPGKRVELDLALKSRDLVLADLGRIGFAGAGGQAAALSGSAAVDLKVRGYYPNLQYSGQLALRRVTVNHPALGVPIEDVSGPVTLSGKKMVTESLQMTVAGLPVTARGEILDPLNPRFDVTLALADADIGRLMSILAPGAAMGDGDERDPDVGSAAPNFANRVSGRGSIVARITGRIGEISTEGSVNFATLAVPAGEKVITATSVKGSFRYADGVLTLREVGAQVADGSVTIEGAMTPGKAWPGPIGSIGSAGLDGEEGAGFPQIRANVKLKGVSAGALGPLILPRAFVLSGTLDGDLVVAGGGRSGPRFDVTGSCRMTSARAAFGKTSFDFASVEASFRGVGGEVTFDRLLARGADGHVDASGTVSLAGGADFRATVSGADLAKLASIAGYEGAGGTLGFAGTVSVRGRDVVADGLADVKRGVISGVEFDSLTGRVKLSRTEARLENVSVRDGKASYLVSGKVGLDGEGGPAIDLSVQINGVPCQDVLSLARHSGAMAAGDLPLRGFLSGEVVVKGPAKSPGILGSVRVSEAELSGVRPERVELDFAFTGGALRIEELKARVGSAEIAAKGVIGSDGALDLAVRAGGMDLARLPVPLPGNLVGGGNASFEGRVAGQLRDPRLEGEVSATNVVLRNVLIPGVAGTVKWNGKEIELAPLAIHDGSGDATVTGVIALEESARGPQGASTLDMQMEVEGLALKTLMDLVKLDFAADASGKVTGQVAIRGDMTAPGVELALQVSNLKVAGVAFTNAVIDARAAGGEIDLRMLKLRQEGGGYLEASGTSKSGGEISFMGSARGFDAGVLASLFGVGYTVSGTLDLAAKIEGTSSDPVATVAMQLTGGVVERVRFDAITARMFFRDGMITIEEGEIVQGGHRASVTGKVPLAGERLAALGIAGPEKREGGLDVAIKMKDASLVFLMMVSDRIEWSEGVANVDLRVTGGLDAPRLQGWASVSGGAVKLALLEDALKDVTARVVFEGSNASINQLSCKLGDGTVSASGTVAFTNGGDPKVDLRLTGTRARISTDQLRAVADARLQVRGAASRPMISGDIKLVRAEFTPSGFGAVSMPVDADLDVAVSTGDDLRIRTKTMDIRASGSVKVGGTLREPSLAGRVEAHRGWFAYFGNEFAVREAVADFREDGGVIPYLEVQADTYAGSTLIHLTLKGTLPDRLTMDLTSSPPKSRDEILALLNYPGALAKILEGDMEGAMKEEIVRILDQELRLQLVGGIERAFEDAFSLDEFRLQRGTSNELTLRIGKYVVDDLYLSYERGFGSQSSGVLRFDYMYGPGVVLTGKFDERGMYTLGVEARLRF
ncbi:MAG: translocation/assembly module TamB domain-containing protein [Firmicutes bacterium]|jgi:autotransporter translocation and assembly factor TamB|nr:translocation/assembly module TamB domain-containing protein [Bacillota bacterium]MDH7494370.1 translocation/assembly module TamB domain-containing protein [Bacillota bacterium]